MAGSFVYPAGHEWRALIAHSQPGTLLWLPMEEASTGKTTLVFVLREESEIIKNLPERRGSVFVEWRMGVFGLETEEGKLVAFLDIMVRTPGGIAEANINVLHLDEDTLNLIESEEPVILAMVGDSGKIERQVMFPMGKNLRNLVSKAMTIFQVDPWTDKEYDAVKEHFQNTMELEEAWEMMGHVR